MPNQGKRIAILIASDVYQHDEDIFHTLKSPKNDIEQLDAVLVDSKKGFFDQVIPMYQESSSDVFEKIEILLSEATSDDLLLIYYSGHGWTDIDGNLYLTFINTKTRAIRSSSIPFDNLKSAITDPSLSLRQTVLILDCCYAGNIDRSFLKGNSVAEMENFAATAEGTVIFAASDAFQVAKQGDDGISVFTKHLLEGISTGAADSARSGFITAAGLASYITKELVAENRQRPRFFGVSTSGEIVLARSDHESDGQALASSNLSRLDRLIYELSSDHEADVVSAISRLGLMGKEASRATPMILVKCQSESESVISSGMEALLNISEDSAIEYLKYIAYEAPNKLPYLSSCYDRIGNLKLPTGIVQKFFSISASFYRSNQPEIIFFRSPEVKIALSQGNNSICAGLDCLNDCEEKHITPISKLLDSLGLLRNGDLGPFIERILHFEGRALAKLCGLLAQRKEIHNEAAQIAFRRLENISIDDRYILEHFLLNLEELKLDLGIFGVISGLDDREMALIVSLKYSKDFDLTPMCQVFLSGGQKSWLIGLLSVAGPKCISQSILAKMLADKVEPFEFLIRQCAYIVNIDDELKDELLRALDHERITARLLAARILFLHKLSLSEKRWIIQRCIEVGRELEAHLPGRGAIWRRLRSQLTDGI